MATLTAEVGKVVKNATSFKALKKWLKKQTDFCFDTETLGIVDLTCTGCSFGNDTGVFAVVFTEGFTPDEFFSDPVIIEAFTNENNWVTIHNAKFDFKVLMHYGIRFQAKAWDTMIGAFHVQEKGKHGLKHLSKEILGHEMGAWDETIHLKENREKFVKYMLEDAIAPHELKKHYEPELRKQKLWYSFRVDCALQRVLMDMENKGFLVDRKLLEQMKQRLIWRMFTIERHAWGLAGKKFNLTSPHEIRRILYDEMGLKPPPGSLTPSGKPSTKQGVLERMQGDVPFLKDVIKFRGYRKLLSTYVEGLLSRMDDNNRLHSDFGIITVVTGRLSSYNPNMQNLPRVHGPDDPFRVRDAFIAPPGYSLIVADYSQLELRVLAHRACDQVMIDTFKAGEDIHQTTADICDISRQEAKSVNFGIVYGLSAVSLASTINTAKSEAQDIINKFFSKYAGVRNYINRVKRETAELGYIRTIAGRKRRLPEILSPEWRLKGHAERQAVNTSIQGSASDIIKRAMLGLEVALVKGECDMLIQVHDELVFECRTDLVDKYMPIIQHEMEHPFETDLGCPLEVLPKVVTRWGHGK